MAERKPLGSIDELRALAARENQRVRKKFTGYQTGDGPPTPKSGLKALRKLRALKVKNRRNLSRKLKKDRAIEAVAKKTNKSALSKDLELSATARVKGIQNRTGFNKFRGSREVMNNLDLEAPVKARARFDKNFKRFNKKRKSANSKREKIKSIEDLRKESRKRR